jgi:hypothetical protein
MSNYIGSVPAAKREPDWRTRGACQDHDPEIFFSTLAEPTAKVVCRGCPVVEQCLHFALDENISHGVFGGLNDGERAVIKRMAVQWKLTTRETYRRLRGAEQSQPRTMRGLFEEGTIAAFGDHLTWVGTNKPKFKGRAYTPAQLAFIVGRGRAPEGAVRRTCGSPDCVRPEHLTDGTERRANTIQTAA